MTRDGRNEDEELGSPNDLIFALCRISHFYMSFIAVMNPRMHTHAIIQSPRSPPSTHPDSSLAAEAAMAEG